MFIFDSLPGSGTVYSSRLLAALGTDRSRWASVDDLLCFAGVAPVMERSGKQARIRWRYFCPKFLRQSSSSTRVSRSSIPSGPKPTTLRNQPAAKVIKEPLGH
ncbi:MAG: transposase [Pyrinomonadaceae bacterium]